MSSLATSSDLDYSEDFSPENFESIVPTVNAGVKAELEEMLAHVFPDFFIFLLSSCPP